MDYDFWGERELIGRLQETDAQIISIKETLKHLDTYGMQNFSYKFERKEYKDQVQELQEAIKEIKESIL